MKLGAKMAPPPGAGPCAIFSRGRAVFPHKVFVGNPRQEEYDACMAGIGNPIVALFNLGGGEIILIVVLLMMFLAVPLLVLLIALVVIWTTRKRKPGKPSTTPPSLQNPRP